MLMGLPCCPRPVDPTVNAHYEKESVDPHLGIQTSMKAQVNIQENTDDPQRIC